MSGATEYALMHGVRDWLAGGPADGVLATLRLHRHNCGRTPPQTFLGNHDFARLADVVEPGLLPVAFALLMTLPGVPSPYYGDELGVTSAWTDGGSDALLRPELERTDLETGADLIGVLRRLGALRRANSWLTWADVDDIEVLDGALAYTVTGDGRAIRVVLDPRAGPGVPSWSIDPVNGGAGDRGRR